MMEQFANELVAIISAVASAGIIYLFRPRVKLVYGRANNSRNVLEFSGGEGIKSQTEVYVEKYFLQNLGRVPANNVEFVLSNRPTDVSVWQPRDVRYVTVEKQNFLIGIPQIAPRELIVLDLIYVNQTASFVSSVKCAEALGTEIQFQTIRQFSNWVNGAIALLIFLGIAFIFQTLFSLIGFDPFVVLSR